MAPKIILTNGSYSQNILSELNVLKRENRFCDAVLKLSGESILAQRAVLAAASPFFKDKFNGSKPAKVDVVDLRGYNLEAINILLDYIYTGELQLNEENVIPVMEGAHIFRIDWIIQKCGEFLGKQISKENIFSLISLAEKLNCDNLLEKAKGFLRENYDEILSTKNLEKCTTEQEKSFEQNSIRHAEIQGNLKVPNVDTDFDSSNSSQNVPETTLTQYLENSPLKATKLALETSSANAEQLQNAENDCPPLKNQQFEKVKDFKSANKNLINLDKTLLMTCWAKGVPCIKYNFNKKSTVTIPLNLYSDFKNFNIAMYKNYIFTVGGLYDGKLATYSKKYDIENASWIGNGFSMGLQSAMPGCCLYQDKLYYFGGRWLGGGTKDTCGFYDFTTQSITQLPNMKTSRSYPGVGEHGGAIYVCGGANKICSEYWYNNLSSTMRLDPREGTWISLPLLRRSSGHCSVVSIADQLFCSPLYSASLMDIFDIRRHSWRKDVPSNGLGTDYNWLQADGNKLYHITENGIYVSSASSQGIEKLTDSFSIEFPIGILF